MLVEKWSVKGEKVLLYPGLLRTLISPQECGFTIRFARMPYHQERPTSTVQLAFHTMLFTHSLLYYAIIEGENFGGNGEDNSFSSASLRLLFTGRVITVSSSVVPDPPSTVGGTGLLRMTFPWTNESYIIITEYQYFR